MKVIDNKYQVLKTLGEGFGGSVLLVEKDGVKAALKQLKMQTDHACLTSDEILDNFKQEFTTLKKLNHPHILRILDFGYDPKEKFYYFTTEYIEGQDIFDGTRDLSYEEVEELFVQTLRALSYLHSQGVYHFDIKPQNILVGREPGGTPSAKLIDFGLTALQKKGVLAGSPGFIAPEGLLDEGRDGRSDLYSLGVTWYTCLAGDNPFETDDVKKTLSLHRVWMPPAISSKTPEVPPYLDTILEKLLKKNPAERYHRADQVIRDINWSAKKQYPLETEATALAYLPGEGQLVGRDEEWATLLSYFDRVFLTQSEGKLCVLLAGGPGTGKTRLLKELKYHAQLQTIPVLDLATASPKDIKSDCLLIADDADQEALETAELWMRQFQTHSLMIVLAGRNLGDLPGLGFYLSLKNFDRPTVVRYIASVLGMSDAPEFLVDELSKRTEGNPLLLTELLQSLLQSHQIFDKQGRWSASLLKEVGIDFSKLKVPKTMEEYCEQKYKELSPTGQKLLSITAIAKAPLDRGHLVFLDLDFSNEQWRNLEEKHLIELDPVSGEIRLINPSFREWILNWVPSETLAELHQTLGELFLKDPELQEAAWHHLGFGLAPPEERYAYLVQYGEALLEQYRWFDAAGAFESATKIAPSPEKEAEATLKRVKALFRACQHSEALNLLEQTQGLLKRERAKEGQWRWIQQTFREMGNIYLKESRLDRARESLKAAQVLLEEHEENPVEEMILENFRASLLLREGKIHEAFQISQENHSKWEALPAEQRKQVLNNELPSLLLFLGKKEEAKTLFQEQSAFYREIGNQAKRAYALYGWAEAAYSLKEFEEAIQKYRECVDLARELKNEELLFHAFNGLGNIAYVQNDWFAAIGYYQNALELAQHYGDVDSSVGIAINLSLVFRLKGDLGSGQIYLKHVIDTLEALSPPSYTQLHFLTQAYLEMGALHRENERWIESRDSYRDSLRLVRNHPILEGFRFNALLGLAQSAIALGRDSEAQASLKELEKGKLSPSEREELEKIKPVPEVPKKASLLRKK